MMLNLQQQTPCETSLCIIRLVFLTLLPLTSGWVCFKMCLIIFSSRQQTSEFIWMKQKCVVCKQCTQVRDLSMSILARFFHINAVDLYFFSYVYRLGAKNWFLFSYHSDSSPNNPWFLVFITELIAWLEINNAVLFLFFFLILRNHCPKGFQDKYLTDEDNVFKSTIKSKKSLYELKHFS